MLWRSPIVNRSSSHTNEVQPRAVAPAGSSDLRAEALKAYESLLARTSDADKEPDQLEQEAKADRALILQSAEAAQEISLRFVATCVTERPDIHERVADAVLAESDEGHEDDDIARAILLRELKRHTAELAHILLDDPTDDIERGATSLIDGSLWADEFLARQLEGVGNLGRKTASLLREYSREQAQPISSSGERGGSPSREFKEGLLWWLWLPLEMGPIQRLFLFQLARVIWKDVVPDEVRRALCPSLPGHGVTERLVAILSPQCPAPRQEGDSVVLLDRGGMIEASLEDHRGSPIVSDEVFDLAASFTSITMHRVIRHLVYLAWFKKFVKKINPYHEFEIKGGFSGFAEEIDERTPKGRRAVRLAIC
jgi:hypothetical protein